MIPKSSVLLIEDEENIRSFIATTLKNQNYKITTASCGTEGLHLCASLCPDVVLLDLGLPDMDGIDVIKKLREWSCVPIIVISARTHEQEKAKALDSSSCFRQSAAFRRIRERTCTSSVMMTSQSINSAVLKFRISCSSRIFFRAQA